MTWLSDPTCHSSWSHPASSLSSPAWWSLRSWATRRNSGAACPSPPRTSQSRSGWSSPCASYHCSTRIPGSPLRPDCTLRRTEGHSQHPVFNELKVKTAEARTYGAGFCFEPQETPPSTDFIILLGIKPSSGALCSKKGSSSGLQKMFIMVVWHNPIQWLSVQM